MSTIFNQPIPVGKPHCTVVELEVLIYDYDQMGVKSLILPVGTLFQPWQPLDHWRGQKIPITLGDGAKEFDWGVTAIEGHFLSWHDFFMYCQLAEVCPSANSHKTQSP